MAFHKYISYNIHCK